jgi:hypothetical protein
VSTAEGCDVYDYARHARKFRRQIRQCGEMRRTLDPGSITIVGVFDRVAEAKREDMGWDLRLFRRDAHRCGDMRLAADVRAWWTL